MVKPMKLEFEINANELSKEEKEVFFINLFPSFRKGQSAKIKEKGSDNHKY
jgi:hypothetical protein